MNPDKNEVQVPNFEGEKMKMPENSVLKSDTTTESTVVSSPLLITLTILLVVILGGMYFWFESLNSEVPVTPAIERPTAEENNEPESTTAEAQVQTMETTSTSDEIEAIEADLESTNLDSLDSELQAIDAELEAEASRN